MNMSMDMLQVDLEPSKLRPPWPHFALDLVSCPFPFPILRDYRIYLPKKVNVTPWAEKPLFNKFSSLIYVGSCRIQSGENANDPFWANLRWVTEHR